MRDRSEALLDSNVREHHLFSWFVLIGSSYWITARDGASTHHKFTGKSQNLAVSQIVYPRRKENLRPYIDSWIADAPNLPFFIISFH